MSWLSTLSLVNNWLVRLSCFCFPVTRFPVSSRQLAIALACHIKYTTSNTHIYGTKTHTLKYETSHILVYFSQERFSCLKFKFMFCKISWGTMNAVQTKLLLLRSTFILGNKSKDFYFVSMWSGVRIEQKHPLSFAEEDIECRFWQKMSMSPAGRKSLQFYNDFYQQDFPTGLRNLSGAAVEW